MDGDGKIACSQSTGQCRSLTRGPSCLMLWPLTTEALPTSRCRAVSGTWRFATAEFVARGGRLSLLLPTAVCADEKASRDGAEPCAAPESCGSREFHVSAIRNGFPQQHFATEVFSGIEYGMQHRMHHMQVRVRRESWQANACVLCGGRRTHSKEGIC
jgi:hypothetical protein